MLGGKGVQGGGRYQWRAAVWGSWGPLCGVTLAREGAPPEDPPENTHTRSHVLSPPLTPTPLRLPRVLVWTDVRPPPRSRAGKRAEWIQSVWPPAALPLPLSQADPSPSGVPTRLQRSSGDQPSLVMRASAGDDLVNPTGNLRLGHPASQNPAVPRAGGLVVLGTDRWGPGVAIPEPAARAAGQAGVNCRLPCEAPLGSTSEPRVEGFLIHRYKCW